MVDFKLKKVWKKIIFYTPEKLHMSPKNGPFQYDPQNPNHQPKPNQPLADHRSKQKDKHIPKIQMMSSRIGEY